MVERRSRRVRLLAWILLASAIGLLAVQDPSRAGKHGPPPISLERMSMPGIASVVYVARIDLRQVALALYPGTSEPPVAVPRGPASIPTAQRWRLLATFNGGFKYTSIGSENGFSVDGHTYVWLKRGLGTLVEHSDGSVDIETWHGGPLPPPSVVLARQNLPLIVDRGRPAVGAGNNGLWGATLGGLPAVWRTGIGLDTRGDLVFVAASDLTAWGLATALVRAGAIRAIELDINPEWPTFIVYGHKGGLRPWMFVPNPQQSPRRYLSPDSRDFFALYRRAGARATVPFR